MTRRATAFMLVWAYACGIPWMLLTAPDTFALLLLFPPGYFFVGGLFFGVIHEAIATRWPRFWVTAAVAAIALESGLLLYGGKAPGTPLGILFACAVLCASLTVTRLNRCKAIVMGGTWLGGLLVLCWILFPGVYFYRNSSVKISPDGAFKAWVMTDGGNEDSSFHIGPRYSWNGAFGQRIVQSDIADVDGVFLLVEIDSFSWSEKSNIHLTGLFPKPLPSPGFFLPISVTPIENQDAP